MSILLENFKSQAATWFLALIFSILSIYAGFFTEKINFSLKKSDLRASYYKELCVDVSGFVFASEYMVEVLENNWTNKEQSKASIGFYETYIVAFRKNEYVYEKLLRDYWSKKDLENYQKVTLTIREIDRTLHGYNGDFYKIIFQPELNVKEIPKDKYSENLKNLQNLVLILQNQTRTLLNGLQ